ncbi:unnamed protein product [Colias eurytheme]|nr:unnamed protein product [Colias eurytheme]
MAVGTFTRKKRRLIDDEPSPARRRLALTKPLKLAIAASGFRKDAGVDTSAITRASLEIALLLDECFFIWEPISASAERGVKLFYMDAAG